MGMGDGPGSQVTSAGRCANTDTCRERSGSERREPLGLGAPERLHQGGTTQSSTSQVSRPEKEEGESRRGNGLGRMVLIGLACSGVGCSH